MANSSLVITFSGGLTSEPLRGGRTGHPLKLAHKLYSTRSSEPGSSSVGNRRDPTLLPNNINHYKKIKDNKNRVK